MKVRLLPPIDQVVQDTKSHEPPSQARHFMAFLKLNSHLFHHNFVHPISDQIPAVLSS